MARWLLNTFPTWLLALIIVGASVALALLALRFVRRRFPGVAKHEGNDLVGVVIGVLAGVYGIILGFVIVSLYEDFQDAGATVQDEGAQLVQLYEDTRGLPIAGAIEEEIKAYVAEVRYREWELMRDGKLSEQVAGEHLPDMYALLQKNMPNLSETDLAFHEDAVERVNGVAAARLDRLRHSRESLPAVLVFLLVAGGILLMGSLLTLADTTPLIKDVMVVAAAGLTSFTLLIALGLDHPFSGDISVSNEPLTQGRVASLGVSPADLSGR